MTYKVTVVLVGIVLVGVVGVASADVLNMDGTRNADGSWNGLASLETVTIGNPGNPADSTGFGRVNYDYRIGKYEVTAGQYTEFLNAVAGIDAHGLYDTRMRSNYFPCKIQRYAGSGTAADPYRYSVASDWANRPVTYLDVGDCCRFVNWLHNGQPTGVQDLTTTEDGAYSLNGVTNPSNSGITRKAGWKWAIASEDEWYKAAYHKNDGVTGNYWLYPTGTNSEPGNACSDPDPGNRANYLNTNTGSHTIGSPYFRTPVGEFENSASPYGTFDQGGNVWEQTEVALFTAEQGLWGGSFSYQTWSMRSTCRGGWLLPTDGDYGFGLRVVQVPEPTTLILVLGGAAILARYPRKSRP